MSGRASRAMHAAAVALAAIAVVGCGGGGGGGTAPPVIDPPVQVKAEVRSGQLDRSALPVQAVAADIDDSGRVVAVYTQSTGDRVALHAVLGEPGLRGGQPTFGAPEPIDAALPLDAAIGEFSVAMSPRGHAVASWVQTAPCTADTYRTSGDCRFVVSARRLSGQGWEAPVRVGDTPSTLPKAIINDSGDVAMIWSGLRQNGAGDLVQTNAVVVMAATANRFAAPTPFDDIQLPDGGFAGLTLDRTGQLTYVTAGLVNGRKQLLARRGSVAGGFNATERLDNLDADVAIEAVASGVNGQVVVLWQQSSGGATHRFAAAVDTPGQAWQLTDLGIPSSGQRSLLAVGDGGNFLRYDLDSCTAQRRTGGNWQSSTALPAGLCQPSSSFIAALARTGDVVGGLFSDTQTAGNTGQWLAYNASRNVLTQALSSQLTDHLLGTPSTLGGRLLLSENGIAALISLNAFDALPSAATPAGTPGTAANLWLTYLRLP